MQSASRSQSAIEFLSVYGWAFLTIALFLAMAVVLVSSRPAVSYLPSTCSIQPSLPCTESSVYFSTQSNGLLVFSLIFTNNLAKPLYLLPNTFNVVMASLLSNGSYSSTGSCSPETAPSGARVICQVTMPQGVKPSIGTSTTSYFTLHYNICSDISACGGPVYATTGLSQATVGGASQGMYLIGLYTNAPGSYVALDGVKYQSGANVPVFGSTHTAYAIPAPGTTWHLWTSTNITLSNPLSQTTNITLITNGTLTASFYTSTSTTSTTSTSTTSTTTTTTTVAYVYCVGGYNGSYSSRIYYSPISDPGVGNWISTSSWPSDAYGHSCVMYNGYVYCFGGYNGGVVPQVLYGPASSNGISSMKDASHNYPDGGIWQQSCVPFGGYVYCVGSPANNNANTTYYSQLSTTTGTSAWNLTTEYPYKTQPGIREESCVTSGSYIYCIGGYNFSSNSQVNNTYYAPLTGSIGSWASTTDYPSPTETESCAAYNGYMYCVGGIKNGQTTNSVYSAPVSAGTIGAWTNTTSYPTNIAQTSCAAYNGYMYCVGGYTTSTSTKSNSVYYASLSNGAVGGWAQGSNYPVAVIFHSCAAYNGYMYCVGGYNSSTATNATYYAPISSSGVGSWTRTSTYPSRTWEHSCVASGGYIYCVGGMNSSGTGYSKAVFSAPVSPSGIGSWTGTTPYPATDIYLHSCAAYNSTIYCVGGANYSYSAVHYMKSVYYAALAGPNVVAWAKGPNYPQQIAEHSCSASNGYMYCVGGYNNSTYIANTYSAPLTGHAVGGWAATTPYPTKVYDHSCVSYNGYVYCVGGYNASAYSKMAYYAQLSNSGIGNWAQTTSYPTPIRSGSCITSGGYVYCVGGMNASASRLVYYASLSPSGIGAWNATTPYPIKLWGLSCVTPTTTSTSTQTTTSTTTSTTTTTTTTTSTTTIGYYYSTITLTNSNGASAAPFQQKITFSPSSYSNYETDNLGNIRFYQNSTELYSWCESGCTDTSSSAVFWVRMPSGVASGSSSITLRFYMSGNRQYDAYAGEAPQLSSTYGMYDNGASVFNFYDGFPSGESTSSKWVNEGSPTVTVNGGLTLTGPTTAAWTGLYSIDTYNPQTTVLDGYVYFTGFSSSQLNEIGYYYSQAHGTPYYDITDYSTYYLESANGSKSATPFSGGSTSAYNLFSMWTSATQNYGSLNYGTAITVAGAFSASTSQYIGLIAASSSYSVKVQWIRARAYPPSGVMPSTSLGSIGTG